MQHSRFYASHIIDDVHIDLMYMMNKWDGVAKKKGTIIWWTDSVGVKSESEREKQKLNSTVAE